MTYTVRVDDNYHYMDESERYTHGEFETYDEALAACRGIVDRFLASAYEPGATADWLYAQYTSFGDDPFIIGDVPEGRRFSAWNYAKERCVEICQVTGGTDVAAPP
jgi:hypothetical protein